MHHAVGAHNRVNNETPAFIGWLDPLDCQHDRQVTMPTVRIHDYHESRTRKLTPISPHTSATHTQAEETEYAQFLHTIFALVSLASLDLLLAVVEVLLKPYALG